MAVKENKQREERLVDVEEEKDEDYDRRICYSTLPITALYSMKYSDLYQRGFKKPYVSSSCVSNEDFSPIGAGLYNLGDTCFLNSVLQCLTHTVPLLQNLVTLNHPSKCRRNTEDFCVFCALRVQIDVSLQSAGKLISPDSFVNNLEYICSSFHRGQQQGQQQDAHECLQCLFAKIDESCCKMDTQVSCALAQEDSFINSIFGVRLKSQRSCCDCGYLSITPASLTILSLEITNVDTLVDALHSFTKVEKLENAKFICDGCKKEVVRETQLKLDQAPPVAIFHLKRFSNKLKKIHKNIKYPLELDLQPYTGHNDQGKLEYELYAVIVQSGNFSSGHYFCYIRSSPGTWFLMDDSRVAIVSEQNVLSQQAYILFYAKKGTPCFSSFFSEMRTKNTKSASVLP